MDRFNQKMTLGRGTYGTVYLCERKHNNKEIVVKEINNILLDKSQKNVAMNEVQILQKLNHPNIIKYIDSFVSKSTFYIVMEYAAKGNLHSYIDYNRKLGSSHIQQQIVVSFFTQIVMGLEHIHKHHIIHRDLKSENILITGWLGNVVKIGDFGVSKVLENKNFANTQIGTTYYLPPEICHGQNYTEKSDIWALGCILFEMCAMKRLFDGPIGQVIMSISIGKCKKINQEHYDAELQTIIDKCLLVIPDDRPRCKDIFQKFPLIMYEMNHLVNSLGNVTA